MRVCGRVVSWSWSLSLQPGVGGNLTLCLPTDMFPRVAKRRRLSGPPGRKWQVKQRRPDRDRGRGRGGAWRPSEPKGRPQGAQAKPRLREAAPGRSRVQHRPPKRST
jgi:hypothetical protein